MNEGLKTLFFKGDLFRVNFKIISSGFAMFMVKNNTKYILRISVSFIDAKNIKICKSRSSKIPVNPA
jgi:hypothetical protein